ncbi:MAG: hypothetical protein A2X84_05940 [Desulfuromonadaceae bacterium GWC2_58_13]|nr:MAG: hypothetical protein A2X84_05940 [Desulfuromonadaceae bacterium GWC2_58_13]
MKHLTRFGILRLQFLQSCKPELLQEMQHAGALEDHLVSSQRSAEWELDQLIFAGMEEEEAELFILNEYIMA